MILYSHLSKEIALKKQLYFSCLVILVSTLSGRTYSSEKNPIDDDLLSLVFQSASFENKMGILNARPQLIEYARIDISALLNSIDPAIDFQDEAIKAGMDNYEPAYLKKGSKLLTEKVQNFSDQKLGKLSTREHLTKHAQSLIFTMYAFNYPASEAAKYNAKDAALHLRTCHCAAIRASKDAVWYQASSVAWNACHAIFGLPKYYNPDGCCSSAAAFVSDSVYKAKPDKNIESVLYRVAEKYSWGFYLKNIDSILEKSYTHATSLIEEPRDSIFESVDSWTAFKHKYFSKLDQKSQKFLNPWLTELDRVADMIENAQE